MTITVFRGVLRKVATFARFRYSDKQKNEHLFVGFTSIGGLSDTYKYLPGEVFEPPTAPPRPIDTSLAMEVTPATYEQMYTSLVILVSAQKTHGRSNIQ